MLIFPDVFGLIVLAIALLLIPVPWLVAWVIAVIVHEMGHYIALKICGVTVYGVRMKLAGVQMDTAPMSGRQELICSLAGPLCGLCTLLLSGHFPRVAICAAIQSCYNLLPLYPLDGGRGVRCVLQMVCSTKRIVYIEQIIRYGCFGILVVLGSVATFVWKLGISPILLVCWILCRNGNLKTPCKEGEQIVQ